MGYEPQRPGERETGDDENRDENDQHGVPLLDVYTPSDDARLCRVLESYGQRSVELRRRAALVRVVEKVPSLTALARQLFSVLPRSRQMVVALVTWLRLFQVAFLIPVYGDVPASKGRFEVKLWNCEALAAVS